MCFITMLYLHENYNRCIYGNLVWVFFLLDFVDIIRDNIQNYIIWILLSSD
jgi:hypothetical protein